MSLRDVDFTVSCQREWCLAIPEWKDEDLGRSAPFYFYLIMKKLLTLIFLSMIAFNAIHAEITWTLSDDGTLTISGTDMPNYHEIDNPNPWYSQRNKIKKIVIEDGVTNIGDYTFLHCSSLTSVSIPISVKSIGKAAFAGNPNLTSINIPKYVTSIGSEAFSSCYALTSVTIPNSVTSVGHSAFSDTKWYNDQPDGLIYVGVALYKYKGTMQANTAIDIRKGTKMIAERAFERCTSLTSVNIPNSLTSIGRCAFYGCSSLTSIIIPNSVTTIGNYAFQGCSTLTSVIIPNSVISIGSYAFAECSSLTSVNIPNSVTSVGWRPFHETKWYKNQSDGLIYIGSFLYGYKGTMPANTKIDIIEGTKGIVGGAFYGYSSLTSVNIPNSVESINVSAFSGCSGLTSINIPNSVTSIESEAFYGCSALTSATIPNSVTSIKERTFYSCSSLSSITIPNSVTDIESGAFSYCRNLTSITIPSSVTNIGSVTFMGCWALTSVTIPNSVTSIGNLVFAGCSSLSSITIPNSVTNIESQAFQSCRNLTSIIIPNTVKKIGEYAFENCPNINIIICKASTPPDCGTKCFYDINKSIQVYVPANNVGEYKKAIEWKDFINIKAIIEPVSILFANDSENLVVGMTKVLEATITPEDAMDKTIIWTSSNTEVATVSAEGIVTAKETGTTVITATTYNGKTVKCTITVEQPVTAITLSDATTSLWVGKTKTLTATITPKTASNTAVNWISSDTKIATVSSEGVITAQKKGTCTITCTAADGYGAKSTCEITVKQQVASIAISDVKTSLWVGETKSLTAIATPKTANNTGVNWISSNTKVATVSSEGVVTAKKKGACIITCTAADGYGTKSTCEVTVKEPVTNIVLSDAIVPLWVGETKTLTATASPTTASNTSVEWSSSDDNVATVSSEGVITAKGQGTCTITCTASDGYGTKSTCEITIKQQVSEIALSETNASLWVGDTRTLTATVSPTTANKTSVEWYSSDDNVASVSSEGVITANGEGTCTITCTAADGYGTKSICEVTVKQQVTEIVLSETTVSLWVGETKTLSATVSPTTASNTAVEWSSSDDKVASVSSEGVITANGEGTCTITCTAADGYGAVSICEVTVMQQTTSLEDLRFANDKSPVYNLNGQRINKAHAQKGIYIKNGKKYANKN